MRCVRISTKKITLDIPEKPDRCALDCSRDGDVHIFIQYDDPEGFNSGLARYGSFRNVQNYIVLAGKKGGDFSERCGYWGEKLVLYAQQLGLNTCWTALTFNRSRVKTRFEAVKVSAWSLRSAVGKHKGFLIKAKVAARSLTLSMRRTGLFPASMRPAPTAASRQKFRFLLPG